MYREYFPLLSFSPLFSDHREGADAVCRHLIKELPSLLHKGENGEGQALGPLEKRVEELKILSKVAFEATLKAEGWGDAPDF